MKKNDIITSKHVDHIENEKKILEMISHPFIVSHISPNLTSFWFRWNTMVLCKMISTSTSWQSFWEAETCSLITEVWATSIQNKQRFMGHRSSQSLSTCKVWKLFTETWSLRISWLGLMVTFRWLTLVSPKSSQKELIQFAERQSTLHLKFCWIRVTERQ